ncbi:1,4-dihydroxy-6-naphthoate synthase [Chitinophaga sancti]|uniref:1,4-dihydroxy-6-naphtoate synthase n=1 Tax=Chitinophaga sancti TaxID=1004 RepID=A0A1K1PC29_9BACT|nr:1,4-dihydroxy-6-naphthoate synthase [Chitinophaga sancti]WQD65741.1 1,4-dihydroxy-6-naphthoate synthase [Chitinophaga sancti]WQG88637.1 1,4-dihydroxy-6-naphthoate synthase [Chitinophaga sancti]SFW45151.1 1,4-dihydroxy-6-naphthoate synthase [Chitinophaga sancti]
MELTLGFSPCPNDTFIFDAMVNNKIDTKGLRFKTQLEDVETLNKWALEGKLDITKLSYGVLPKVLHQYELLNSGSALGRGCGPLLIAKRPIDRENIKDCKIAIPGINTTANLLFSTAFPEAKNKEILIFSDIENAVLDGRVDAGVIIHENRFTYQQRGLVKIIDLGEYWESTTGSPIPLGGIVVRKSLPAELKQLVDQLIHDSLQESFKHYPSLSPFVTSHAQEMEESVMRQHIELYVNDFSLDLGEAGRAAIDRLMAAAL